jgi:endonuclease I
MRPLVFSLRPSLGLAGLILASPALGQIPNGYYDSIDPSSAATLRASLHLVIDDHIRYPYTSSGVDTWDILELAQTNPANSNEILDVYKNEPHTKVGGGTANYDREHPWPKSFGFPNYTGTNYPYTDCHVLFLCNFQYNSARSNKPYDTCSGGCDERVTLANNNQGGGSGTYPGNSNWTDGSGEGRWETWIGRRGDVARALLYMDVRYEGGTHGQTGAPEPDLILTDDLSLIAASNTGINESVAYMGMRSVLLQWHEEDPVDDFERDGHEIVYSYQANRNPFIDHPEWVDCLFLDNCDNGVSPYCFGDSSGTLCPCFNSGAPESGCANSQSSNGATLLSSGSTSLSADDLVFTATNTIANSPGLFFVGPNPAAGGLGITLGDGLLCISGSIKRLDIVFATSGGEASSFSSMAAGLGLLPGETRYYQWWYRDTSAIPCGTPFNLSNGLAVTWQL